ncbi:DapH/DapD/GlmU-related protein [Maribacter sp. 2-571]|uniref:DapH/DapD/GlmU-related protein n=1 Tax=Maribacter sp. 2-571 TaxID=3417569 RepID=UPI003D341BA8
MLKNNRVHHTARIGSNTLVSNTTVGMGTYIAVNTVMNMCEIGNYCSIAAAVQIGGMEHSHWWLSTSPRLTEKQGSTAITKIGNDVWIGAGAIIKRGVTIGDGAVIGAASFVNTDVPENTIYFGSPAKFYKKRLDPTIFEAIKESGYWTMNESNARLKLAELDAKYFSN